MVHAEVRDVQSQPAALPRRVSTITPPRAAQRADDLLKSLDYFDERTVVGLVATISNACRIAGWSFQDTYFEYRTAYAQLFRAGRRRVGSEPQVRAYAHVDWVRLARKASPHAYGVQARAELALAQHEAIDDSTLDNPNDQVLLHVLVDVAFTQKHADAIVSVIRLAELVGIGRDTVIEVVRRCEQLGVLSVDRPGWSAEEGRYLANRMQVHLGALQALSGPAAGVAADAPLSDRPVSTPLGGWAGGKLVHDLFTGVGSLRARGRLLVHQLRRGGMSRTTLRSVLKCGRNTVGRLLGQALAAGLVEETDGVLHLAPLLLDATTDVEIEAIFDCGATELETTGALQKLRDVLANHRSWLDKGAHDRRRDWDIYRLKLAKLRDIPCRAVLPA